MARVQLPYAGQSLTPGLIDNLFGELVFNVQNPAYAGGARGDGSTDDTAAINAAISAATQTVGNVLFFPPGVYVISSPLVITTSGLHILGGGPGNTMGGGGSGTGTFVPGTAGSMTGVVQSGAVIAPSSSFAKGGANAAACILIDASGGEVDQVTVERLNFYGGNFGNATCHGVATWGRVNAFKVSNCGFRVFYGTGSHGVALLEDAGAHDADGAWVDSCLAQFIGGDGFHLGPFGDGTAHNCHSQNVGGYGFFVTDSTGYTSGGGGNIRLLNCRADLSGMTGTGDGFFFNVSCGGFGGMINVSNCSTQRNKNNGFHMAALASTETCPVYLDNCTAQGDGTDALSSGYRINGPAYVSMANCSCHVNGATVDGALYPVNAITTAAVTQAPQLLVLQGGFYNARTTWNNKSAAPSNSSVNGVWTLTGSQFNFGSTLAGPQTAF